MSIHDLLKCLMIDCCASASLLWLEIPSEMQKRGLKQERTNVINERQVFVSAIVKYEWNFRCDVIYWLLWMFIQIEQVPDNLQKTECSSGQLSWSHVAEGSMNCTYRWLFEALSN
jgi:hypothetical protein